MGEGQHESVTRRRNRAEPRLEQRIGALADSQHGAVALYQLKDLGMAARRAQRRVERGEWLRMHDGVYFVGRGPITLKTRWMAAVLAYGPKAVLSHRDSAQLQGIWQSSRKRIDVSLPRKSVRQKRGIHAHAAATLTEEDITEVDGIPCTTWARTLIDLAEVTNRRQTLQAITRTEELRIFDRRSLDAAIERSPTRRGAVTVLSLIDEYHGPTDPAPFIAAFLSLCKRAGLPPPEQEALIDLEDGPIHVDFLWRKERIAVELDSRAFHDTTRSIDTDSDRDQQLALAGYTPTRVTGRHLNAEAPRTENRLKRLHRMRAASTVAV